MVRTHLIVNCVLVFFTLSAVFLRLYSRFKTSANLWVDDYLILLAMPLGITMLAIQGLCDPSFLSAFSPIPALYANLAFVTRCPIGSWAPRRRSAPEPPHDSSAHDIVRPHLHLLHQLN